MFFPTFAIISICWGLNILNEKIIKLLATGFGSGYAPVAPGTAGSIVGVLLYFLLACFSWLIYLLFLLVFTAVAVYVAREAEVVFGQKDPPCIVIDEVAGLLWTMLFVSPAIPGVIIGFLLFRFFDIVKPFPVRFLQDRLPGGYGVVGDDVMAGIYSNLVLQVLIKFL
jgi:phosphatidylglycerophosphatase A